MRCKATTLYHCHNQSYASISWTSWGYASAASLSNICITDCEIKFNLLLKASPRHLWRLPKMEMHKCHSRRALYQSAVCVFIILSPSMQFRRFPWYFAFASLERRWSGFPAVIRSSLCGIRKIQACIHRQPIGWFIITQTLLTRLLSASRASREKYFVNKAILDIIQKDENSVDA